MKCPRTLDDNGTRCAGELRAHCQPTSGATLTAGKVNRRHPTCKWRKCTRCAARLDLERGRGFLDNHPFTFGAAA